MPLHYSNRHVDTVGSNAQHENQDPKRDLYSQLFMETWTVEYIAILLTGAATMLLTIVGTIFDNQRLNQWHSEITINALFNFVSQFIQTALFVPVASSISQLKWIWCYEGQSLRGIDDIDQASRQPLDSLLLMIKRPKTFLAHLAALNTTLILLIGPFAQQSVSIRPCLIPLNNSIATIPTTKTYKVPISDDRIEFRDPDGELNGYTFHTVPAPIKGQILQALSGSAGDFGDVKASCSTANCTFEPYSSIGLCSSLEDCTSKIIRECTSEVRNFPTCSFSIPELESYPTLRTDNFSGKGLWIGASALNSPIINDTSYVKSGKVKPVSGNAEAGTDIGDKYPIVNTLSEFYVLYSSSPNQTVYENVNVTANALKGSLRLCIYTFHTDVLKGQTNTNAIKVHDNLSWQDEHIPGGWPPHPGKNRLFTTIPDDPDQVQYEMDWSTKQAFTNYMNRELFFGSWDMVDDVDSATSDTAKEIARALYVNPATGFLELGDKNRVDSMMKNIAITLTNGLRTTTSRDSTQANGTALSMEIFIFVNLYWLILPVVSVILALVFLVVVISQSRVRGIPARKSSQFRMLTLLEPDMRAIVKDHKEAARVKVRLRKDNEGSWVLEQDSGKDGKD